MLISNFKNLQYPLHFQKSPFFSALTFLFLQKMTKKPFGSTESKDLHFDDDGDLRG